MPCLTHVTRRLTEAIRVFPPTLPPRPLVSGEGLGLGLGQRQTRGPTPLSTGRAQSHEARRICRSGVPVSHPQNVTRAYRGFEAATVSCSSSALPGLSPPLSAHPLQRVPRRSVTGFVLSPGPLDVRPSLSPVYRGRNERLPTAHPLPRSLAWGLHSAPTHRRSPAPACTRGRTSVLQPLPFYHRTPPLATGLWAELAHSRVYQGSNWSPLVAHLLCYH